MDLKHIETFLATVEWGSFSQAAKQLFLSQPTVSLHIKQLEDELGIPLISRTTKSHELTAEGQEFYKYAKSLIQMKNNIKATFSKNDEEKVTIGASSIAAAYLLPPLLETYTQQFDSRLTIYQADSIQIVNDVALGAINIGIVGSKAMNNSLLFKEIYKDHLVIATPYEEAYLKLQEKKANAREVLKHPFISREEGSGTYKESFKILRDLNIDPFKLDVAVEVNSNEALKELIKRGLGISILSEIAIQSELENQQMLAFEIDGAKAERNFYLVYRKDSLLPSSHGNLLKFLEESFQI